ncbi:vestigial like 4 like [Thalassophryne amazonica]|uniref:vestigial like 4 like n=1 Tax=Thalassophryne amazonica TaxID=390379 RepID=UPI001470EE90|nr:vestigial like 4 like [Thalassophryne amazonica]
MAVANFHYITRMSSGFKVYILEGQPHLRSEDRYRHITTDRGHGPPVYPIKHKRRHERGLTLEERRECALSKSSAKAAQRSAPAVFSSPHSPTSTWNPPSSPCSPVLPQIYCTPPMDEPLPLIKKLRKEPDNMDKKPKSTATDQTQMRPSVITCVSSIRSPTCRSEVHKSPSLAICKSNYDHVVEEHFQRSLGANYQQVHSRQLSISVSVDDHFAKALGDKWQQLKPKSSSCSSTPPSSPSVTHSPTYSHSPNHTHKTSCSNASPTSSHWPVN